jgi:hypothetical protein
MNFEFQNADICPAMKEAFKGLTSWNGEERKYIETAARHLDQACGILKRGYDMTVLSEHDYDDFLSNIEEAEDALESLGVLEDHEYIRDDLEPRAAELLDVDHVDVDDPAEEFSGEETWLFGSVEPSGFEE